MSDASVLANARRQAELEAQHRDINRQYVPPGTDGDSLRQIPGMSNITDDMLAERATFNLKEHMDKKAHPTTTALDLRTMSPEELEGIVNAAAQEIQNREERKP